MPLKMNPNKKIFLFYLFSWFSCVLLIPFVTNSNKNRAVFPGFLVRGVRGATTRSLLATLYRRFPHESPAILRDYGAHYIVRSSLLDPVTL